MLLRTPPRHQSTSSRFVDLSGLNRTTQTTLLELTLHDIVQ